MAREKFAARVSRIISGSFNALVDAVENKAPEIVMEEAIREIEAATEEIREELAKVVADKHLANSKLMQLNGKYEELAEQAELAVNEDREDLAEAAIAHQLDIELQMPVLENQIADLANREQELEGYIDALYAKHREMREDLRQYRESRKEAELSADAGVAGNARGTVDSKVAQAGSAFDRVYEKTTGLAGSGAMGDRKTAAKLAELEEMARKNRVAERLAVLKNKVKGND